MIQIAYGQRYDEVQHIGFALRDVLATYGVTSDTSEQTDVPRIRTTAADQPDAERREVIQRSLH